MLPILFAALAGLGILILAIIAIYNSLIKLRIKVDEGWSGIDTQLKRRYDLIPNLVETAELKANQNFLELQQTLNDLEDEIQLSRRYYNATVRDYNMKREVFPSNMIAGMFNFKKRDFFEIADAERENVKVAF